MTLPEPIEADELGRDWLAAWSGDREFVASCAAEVGYEDPLAPELISGLAPLEAHAARLREAFPDVRLEPTAPILRGGNHACIPWRLLGTNRGPLAVLPATDRFLTLHGLHYVELRDGRITRARGFFDLYEAATQLGLLPARGGWGEQALMLLRGFGLRR